MDYVNVENVVMFEKTSRQYLKFYLNINYFNFKDGRRHMVSHIRVIRVRCSLCDAGAFFCSDMRVHLMYR